MKLIEIINEYSVVFKIIFNIKENRRVEVKN